MRKLLLLVLIIVLSFAFSTMAYADDLPELQNVVLSGDILSWDAFDGADEYLLTVGSGGSVTRYTTINIRDKIEEFGLSSGSKGISLYARSNYTAISKKWQGTYNYVSLRPRLSTPTNLHWEDQVAMWDAVENAASYRMVFYNSSNNVRMVTLYTENNSYDISQDNRFTNDISYYFSVTAYSAKEDNKYLYPYSETVTCHDTANGGIKLGKIQNFVVDSNGVATWDAYPNATQYIIYFGRFGRAVNSNQELKFDIKSFTEENWKDFTEGDYEFGILAKDSNEVQITEKYIYNYSVIIKNYNLWVNGEKFSGDKLSIECGTGTATFDYENRVLTLENATITESYEFKPNYVSAIYSELGNLTINLIGDNVIELQDTNTDGIDARGGCNITITGPGKLTINSGYYGMYIGDWEVSGGDLIISGDAEIFVDHCYATGLWVNNNVTINSSKVTVIKDNDYYHGIVVSQYGSLYITDSEVNIDTKASGILLGNGTSCTHYLYLYSGKLNVKSVNYAIYCQPTTDDELVQANIYVYSDAILHVESETGGTNVNDLNIVLKPGSKYTKGTSLIEAGVITINEPVLPGDLDESGTITVADVRLLLQAYINSSISSEWTEEELAVMDMDKNRLINISDVRLLLQLYINW